ncbi:TIM-barrel domain-containing protein [Nocardioides rubriscoriae]|uniref:glycoside hydrolase family 31 protein n=1 Tax=Nocardioides rubriscoriae TaxID=642762 RepID=UPI0011E06E90|nr:TIM-barrel domain-containing protein [Nocardioides rubriscoriae]
MRSPRLTLFRLSLLTLVLTATLLVAGPQAQAQPQPRGRTQAPTQDRAVVDGRARFRVITPSLIRMEYAADGRFENTPTVTVPDRDGAAPRFTTGVEGAWRVIRTDRVELRWRRGRDFSAGNLVLTFRDGSRSRTVRPRPDARHSYLGGWTRGLDLSTGREPLNHGILTREGWYVVDDTDTALLVDRGPGFRVRPQRSGTYRDWYAFAYGHDLRRALADLRTLTGAAPLLPRNAFGVWFSKYFAYTDAEFRALVERFDTERVPLDTLSLDTDFKRQNDPIGSALATLVVGQPGRMFAWNGWDWNKDLFPDPDTFVDWAQRRDLALIANIHPSISSNDPQFEATDRAAGGLAASQDCRTIQADTTGQCHVFDWTDPRQLTAYFDLHDTLAATGIDAFWLDWCCEAQGAADAPGLSPDTWINSQYAAYNRGLGSRWPALSRIGGEYRNDGSYGDRSVGAGGTGALAEHRSAIHFTGDTCATWEMLAFEAEHTAAESAIGMPYVSHDIGSFNGAPQGGECNAVTAAVARAPLPDDLYVRWLQLGTFQPLDRVHSNHGQRLPWEYAGRTRSAATKALRLRGEMVPYTYTAARRAVDTGLPINGPLYLRWPRQEAAYRHPTQFTFGRDLVVAPVTTPGTRAAVRLWVPPGQWVERTTGRRLSGPSVATVEVGLDHVPVLVRAGSVLPTHRVGANAGVAPTTRMVLTAYPGRRGGGQLYDDAGTGFGYERSAFTRTSFDQQRRSGTVTVRIGRAVGGFDGALRARTWELRVLAVDRPTTVQVDGRRVSTWSYDARTRSVRVVLARVPSSRGATVRLG